MALEARVSERTRIARELHDTLLQRFHGLLLRFQTVSHVWAERPELAKEKLDSAINEAARRSRRAGMLCRDYASRR